MFQSCWHWPNAAIFLVERIPAIIIQLMILKMKAALNEFEVVYSEWKRLKQAHLLDQAQFVKNEDHS